MSDDLSGPVGLVRSLISQLLLGISALGQNPKLDFIDHPAYIEDLKTMSVDALCDVFIQLVQQLPSNISVFCIIDGVSWYEQDDDCDDAMSLILGSLRGMVDDSHQAAVGPRLSVLLTSTSRSRRLQGWVADGQHVSLSAENIDTRTVSDRALF